MMNLDNLSENLTRSYQELYDYYSAHYQDLDNLNLHRMVLLADTLKSYNVVYIQEILKTEHPSQDGFEYSDNVTGFLWNINSILNFLSRSNYYSDQELEIFKVEYSSLVNLLFEISRGTAAPDQNFDELITLYDQMYNELVWFLYRGNKEVFNDPIELYIENFGDIFSEVQYNEEILIVEDGYFTDPVYIEFWSDLIEKRIIRDDLADQYVQTSPTGTTRNDLFRHPPKSAVDLFINLAKIINRVENHKLSVEFIISDFRNGEFGDYLNKEINT